MRSSSASLRRIVGASVAGLGMALLAAGAAPVAAQQKAALPALVTSIGQSLDGFQTQLSLRRAQIENEYDPLAGTDLLTGKKTLLLAVGASLKGFGEAGTNMQKELKRTEELLDAAKKNGMYIVVLHIGGQERRDKNSDQLLALTVPKADLVIVRLEGDEDEMIRKLAASAKVPVRTVDTIVNMRPVLREVFGLPPLPAG
jgi:Domain of unknown function (DUF6305)